MEPLPDQCVGKVKLVRSRGSTRRGVVRCWRPVVPGRRGLCADHAPLEHLLTEHQLLQVDALRLRVAELEVELELARRRATLERRLARA